MANIKTPVSILLELTVKKGVAPPQYEIVPNINGAPANTFGFKVKVCGVEATGIGSSKQVGKQNAAYNALKLLEENGIYDPKGSPIKEFEQQPHQPVASPVNYIGPLKTLCAEKKIVDPVFTEVSADGPPHAKQFTVQCCVGSVKTVATSTTKKLAKHLCAIEMLKKINESTNFELEFPKKNELPPTEQRIEALERYNTLFGQVIPDKRIKLKDSFKFFVDLMEKFGKTSENFKDDLSERTEESLARILKQLELKHETAIVQEEFPIIFALHIHCGIPFTALGLGTTKEEAKKEALSQTFLMLNYLIQQ